MALGLRRWLLIALMGCVAVAVGLLPRAAEQDRDRGSISSSRAERLHGPLLRTHRWLTWVEVRDSVLRVVDDSLTAGYEGPFRVIDQRLPPLSAVVVDSAVKLAVDGLPESAAVPVTFALVIDTTRRIDGLRIPAANSLVHYTPVAADGRTCMAAIIARRPGVLRFPQHFQNSFLRRPEELVGPCAYFAAFGVPGAGVRAWLESSEYAFARHPAWLLRANRDQTSWMAKREDVAFWLRFAPGMFACAQEDLENCRRLLLLGSERRRSVRAPNGIYGTSVRYPFGEGSSELLSDLLLEIGPDRFARFWSSEGDVEEAFRDAVGLSMERWAARWAHRKLDYYPYRSMPRPDSVVLGLLLSGFFVLASVFWVHRREVG